MIDKGANDDGKCIIMYQLEDVRRNDIITVSVASRLSEKHRQQPDTTAKQERNKRNSDTAPDLLRNLTEYHVKCFTLY